MRGRVQHPAVWPSHDCRWGLPLSRNQLPQENYSTKSIHPLPLCGAQEQAHVLGYRGSMFRPCHTVRGLSRKKALQPTSLYRVRGLHFASLGQATDYFDTVAPTFGAEEHTMQVCKGVRGVYFDSLMCKPNARTLFGHPWCPMIRSVVMGGTPGQMSALSYMCSSPCLGQVLQHILHLILCPSMVVWCPK